MNAPTPTNLAIMNAPIPIILRLEIVVHVAWNRDLYVPVTARGFLVLLLPRFEARVFCLPPE